MSSTIFREKSLKKIASPEQMNDYIRVSSPSVWMVLTAVIVLLAGVCLDISIPLCRRAVFAQMAA